MGTVVCSGVSRLFWIFCRLLLIFLWTSGILLGMLEWVILLGNGNYSTLFLLTNLTVLNTSVSYLWPKDAYIFYLHLPPDLEVTSSQLVLERDLYNCQALTAAPRREICAAGWVEESGNWRQCDTGSNQRALSPALSGIAGTAVALNQAEL